jgi:cell division GTPase FtsZ
MTNEETKQEQTFMDLPDIETPDPSVFTKPEPSVQEDLKKTAIAFGFIGVGQAGGKIVNEFHNLGYRKTIVVNTAQNDFAGLAIPTECQMLLGTAGGAGKNPEVGAKAVGDHREDILSLLRKTFGASVDKILVVFAGGGGTGCGGSLEMIQIAQDYMKEIQKNPSRNVGALMALPKDSEKGAAQHNSAKVMETLFEKAKTDLAPLILVDNEQIAKQWPQASIAQVFNMANKNVCGLFDIFNTLACRPSQYSSFDKGDLTQVLDQGAVIFGTTTLDEKACSSPSAISDAIRHNLNKGILVEGVDLSTSKAGAGVLVGSPDILNNLPSSNVDEAFKTLARVMGSEKKTITVHQGVFETSKPKLLLYTICGGVELPQARLEKLKRG